MKKLELTKIEKNIIEESLISFKFKSNSPREICENLISLVRTQSNGINLTTLERNVIVESLNIFFSITKEIEVKKLSSKVNNQ